MELLKARNDTGSKLLRIESKNKLVPINQGVLQPSGQYRERALTGNLSHSTVKLVLNQNFFVTCLIISSLSVCCPVDARPLTVFYALIKVHCAISPCLTMYTILARVPRLSLLMEIVRCYCCSLHRQVLWYIAIRKHLLA